jgi:hypothetical protein
MTSTGTSLLMRAHQLGECRFRVLAGVLGEQFLVIQRLHLSIKWPPGQKSDILLPVMGEEHTNAESSGSYLGSGSLLFNFPPSATPPRL